MQKKFERIEELLNHLIMVIANTFSSAASKLTPSKIKNKIESGSKDWGKTKKSFKDKINGKTNKLVAKALSTKEKTQASIKRSREKSQELVKKAKSVDVKKVRWHHIAAAILAFIAPALAKIKNFYLTLNPGTIVAAFAIGTVGTLTGINVYTSSKKVIEESRSPASVVTVEQEKKDNSRPKYFKLEEKSFRIANVILPVYLETGNSGRTPASEKTDLRKLVIDFTFVSSNKYIKNFFWENPHLIIDRLNSRVEPIAIDFPLQNEGKSIIKDKLKAEVNILLKDLHIKGQVNNIYIHSIIGA